MDKYKKLASNTLIFSIGSFSSKILSVLLLRLYTSYMSNEMFSTTSLMQMLVNLLEPLASLSMSEAIVRYGLEKTIKKDSLFTSAVAVSAAGIIISMGLFPFIAMYGDFKPYISYMMILLFTSSFRWIMQQHAKVKGFSKAFALDGIMSVCTLTLFNLIFIVGFRMEIAGYLLSLILSDACSMIFLNHMADIRSDFSPKAIDQNLIRTMIMYSLPLIPTKILWWIVGSSDGFMVAGFVGNGENGLYQAAYKIPNLISTISTMFFYAWQMSAISEYNSKERKKFYTKVFDAYVAIMFVGSAGMMLFLKLATNIITAKEFHSAYRMSPLLIVAVLFMSFCMFLSTIYNATNTNNKSLKSSMWAAGVNIVLNLILIPLFKVQGAAAATMIAYFVCFIYRIVDTQQVARFNVSWRRLGIDMVVLMFMAIIVIAGAPLMHLWLFLAFVLMLLFNFGPIEQTAMRVLKR